MRRQLFPLALWWSLTIGWTALCFFLSWQTGEDTGSFSLAIAAFLLDILGAVGIHADLTAFHLLLRTFAHFGVFFLAGFFFAGATESLWHLFPSGKRLRPLCFLALGLVALLTDVPKLWIPGRHLQWDEAALNALGALCGYLVFLAGSALLRRWKRRRCAPDSDP